MSVHHDCVRNSGTRGLRAPFTPREKMRHVCVWDCHGTWFAFALNSPLPPPSLRFIHRKECPNSTTSLYLEELDSQERCVSWKAVVFRPHKCDLTDSKHSSMEALLPILGNTCW